MDETAVSTPSGKNTTFINCFPVGKDLFLPYVACPAPTASSRGTVILLSEWGIPVEAGHDIISALNTRGFNIITYDWYAQGSPNPGYHGTDAPHFRFNSKNLDIFLHSIVLPDFPAPYYVLAKGTGGLFALTAHDILRSQIHRMVIVSPILEVQGRRANSPYHQYMRFRSLISLHNGPQKRHTGKKGAPPAGDEQQKRKSIHKSIRPAPQWSKMVLNAAASVLSPAYCERMALPTLLIISSRDPVSNPRLAREFAYRLRMAESITIHGAAHDILNDRDYYRSQFWKAFDTFIPGSSAPTFRHLMEDNIIL